MPLVVGVDASTTACKVQVRDADSGHLVATGQAPHPVTTPPCSEQHPHAWERAFATACSKAGIPERHHPAAISFAAQQHAAVVLDARGEVIRPAKLWNDTESALDSDALVDGLPDGALGWATACGSVPLPSFTISKLRWLQRCEPESFRRIHSVLLPHDWLTSRLTGRRTTDRGDASGTGYWSPAEGHYRSDLLDLIDDRVDWLSALPLVLGPRQTAGTWAATGALVGPGTGDNMAGALALGLRPGDLALSIGTSGTACTVSERPSADPSGTVAGFADANGQFLPLVCTLNATKVTDSIARLLGITVQQLGRLALDAPGGTGGVTLIPHFDGERTPHRPGATGSLVGLRSDVTPSQVARATIEGVLCNLLAGADALPLAAPLDERRIFLVGGGARSPAFRQSAADLLGRPILVPADDQLAACGAALQAAAILQGCGIDELAATWNLGLGEIVEPDSNVDGLAVRAAYRETMRRFMT